MTNLFNADKWGVKMEPDNLLQLYKKDDILYLLVLPINVGYYYFYKYLHQKNKKNNELIHSNNKIRIIR